MSIMHAEPEMLAATAGELQSINAVARAGNAAVAGPTTGVVPAAADLVSLLTASQFAAHAQLYQAISAEAMAVQEQLATTLGRASAPVHMRPPRLPTPPRSLRRGRCWTLLSYRRRSTPR